ncbi:hypothetical protein COOONC_17519 [Cooperia oncophora]
MNPNFQMANAKTRSVGCALEFCNETGTNDEYYAFYCVYNEKVLDGQPLYKDGLPCSKCSKGYLCDDEKKLCKVIDGRTSLLLRVEHSAMEWLDFLFTNLVSFGLERVKQPAQHR